MLSPSLPIFAEISLDFRNATSLCGRECSDNSLERCGLHGAQLAPVTVAPHPHLPVRWSVIDTGRAHPPENHRDLVGRERAFVIDEIDEIPGIEIVHFLAELQQRRSEERREGKECVSTCRFRWSPNQ